ncbi:MAG TPA: alpha/beta hydrolase [Holophagaceae bacterium]|nr:alpha/beta hydrolase [Holophagaceae bacterium]
MNLSFPRAVLAFALLGQASLSAQEPTTHVYRRVQDRELPLFVFSPKSPAASHGAILLFHGGGWNEGEAAWTFGSAQRFAALGLVAIPVEYRLSDLKTTTPLDAMGDARAAVRWVRKHAAQLGIHPKRIAAYGASAGGHLAACAALFEDEGPKDSVSAAPDALVLFSPAVALAADRWFQKVLLKRACPLDFSPVDNLRPGLPPTLILQGAEDTVTGLRGAQAFQALMTRLGNHCELEVYPGMGHLMTPAGQDDSGMPNPDPKAMEKVRARMDRFLREQGYLDPEPKGAPGK